MIIRFTIGPFKRKVGESNPQPIIGRLVSNQLPEPVRLPSVQLVYAFLHLQVSQALVSCPAIQQLVAVTEKASRSAAVQAVAFAKPPKLSMSVKRLIEVTVHQTHTVAPMSFVQYAFRGANAACRLSNSGPTQS
jgi:hypothetical protein